MTRTPCNLIHPCVILIATTAGLFAAEKPARLEFNRDIRPILSDKCFRCHGPDAGHRRANLRLDRREDAIAVREGSRALSPGHPEDSEMFLRMTSPNPDERMPPTDSGSQLTAAEIDSLKRWIENGAEYQPHWAFLPPRKGALPGTKRTSWPRNALDFFVLARLEQEGLEPSGETDRSTWLRRVSLDLIGLPPTFDELDAFLSDQSPNAFETVVDRLLQSPHFGERMALDWLDGARYADTNGYFSDFERPVWRWRDWVIDAFNRNMPLDVFAVEQLAGDLLPNATLDQRIATGFNRNHTVTNETGIIDEEYRVEYVADRVETTGTVWLGLTIGCARCHDHKYDPISQREFYQLFAFFNNVPETGLAPGEPLPVLTVSTPEYERELAARKAHRAQCERTYQAFAEQVEQDQAAWEATALTSLRPVPRDQLAAEFRFENDLSNSVPEGKNATADEPTNYQPGIRGTALKYESPFHAEFDPALSLDSDEPWTISVWASVEGASLACVLSKLAPADDSRGLEIVWLKGRLKIGLIHRREENAIQVVTKTPAAGNSWNHLALTYDGSKQARGLKVYINGDSRETRIDRDTLTGGIANDHPWKIGRKDDGLGFTGRIDQLRIYRRVLDESLYAGEEISGIVETESGKRPQPRQDRLKEYFILHHAAPETRTAWTQLREARKAEAEWTAAVPKTLVMEELPQPRETFVLNRGQYDQHGEKVEADVPAAFPRLSEGTPRNRLGLAQWLVRDDNPLTARVLVNRYWTLLFGEGLVKTANDFGSQGELPSHPELLDWLAVDFRERGWDLKGLLRQIVLSATYRQTSVSRPELLTRDPENRLLARGPRFRLAGELIRDQTLSVSGLLARRVGGPSVKPYQPSGLWEAVSYDGDLTYVEDQGESLYRRSLYTFWKRQAPPPTLLSFDSPTREVCAVKRSRTNTPLQALVLLNDPTYIEAARKLAEQVLNRKSAPRDRVRFAFRQALGRLPDADETDKLLSLYQRQAEVFQRDPRKAADLLAVGASPLDASLTGPELAAWTTVCGVLLNLDEMITRP
jgi:Protein of unknown function (DUF1553)/Protein of unknown function (DUF1549)/Concanavalin A-like lectin/glucanases superfamily/Planctomycete cytochrome C